MVLAVQAATTTTAVRLTNILQIDVVGGVGAAPIWIPATLELAGWVGFRIVVVMKFVASFHSSEKPRVFGRVPQMEFSVAVWLQKNIANYK